MDKLEMLLVELKRCKSTYAYGQNHLLDTIIARAEELVKGEVETDIRIGY